jgi:hypothetical protein
MPSFEEDFIEARAKGESLKYKEWELIRADRIPVKKRNFMKINSHIWVVLLLSFCYSFANGKNMETYPKEINCIVEEYITNFSNWGENSINKIFIDRLLSSLIENKIIDKSQISFRSFFICKEQSRPKSSPDCFDVEIWEMKSSTDAEELFKFLSKPPAGLWIYDLEKPPKEFFIFKYFIIWVKARWNGTQFVVGEELDKIIKMCFE